MQPGDERPIQKVIILPAAYRPQNIHARLAGWFRKDSSEFTDSRWFALPGSGRSSLRV
jgi:hypothetical protein